MEIEKLAHIIHINAKKKGFWDTRRNVGELLMLVTSELGEALEAHRKSRHSVCGSFTLSERAGEFQADGESEDEAFKKRFEMYVKDTFEDEIADAVIRLLDLSVGLGIDLKWHIEKKMYYNSLREHLHGKKY